MVNLNTPPCSRLFLNIEEAEMLFYRRFVARHGGAFEGMSQPVGGYRLDFPPGTRVARNRDFALCDSYHVVYPDGTHLTWYRVLKIDRRFFHDVLLVPVSDNHEQDLLQCEQRRATGQAARS